MILVDTSVWVDHLRSGDAQMTAFLDHGQFMTHAFGHGELAGLSLDARSAPGTTAQAAVALHHAYCAVESILVRVAR